MDYEPATTVVSSKYNFFDVAPVADTTTATSVVAKSDTLNLQLRQVIDLAEVSVESLKCHGNIVAVSGVSRRVH